jgi:hypothetical protein
MPWYLVLSLLCSAGMPQINGIRVEPITTGPRANLVPDFSFEDVKGGVPAGWRWDQGRTDAALSIDDRQAHSGRQSVRLQNRTPMGAHVYGTLWTEPPIPVKPGTHYTLSFYARSDVPGVAWVGGGRDWRIRAAIRPTGGKWKRSATQFTTAGDETSFVLRILSESPTPGVWVDDIKLEEGAPETFCEPPSNHKGLILSAPDEIGSLRDGPWERVFELYCPDAGSREIEATLAQPNHSSRQDITARLTKGPSRIHVRGEAPELAGTPWTLSVRVRDGETSAEASTSLRFLSPGAVQKRLQELADAGRQLKTMVDAIRQKGMDPSCPLVGVTVVNDFIQYVRADIEHGELDRAVEQVNQMESIANRVRDELESALNGRRPLPEVPRYVTSPITIDGPSFVAEARFPASGRTERRPVFFTGYGHFNQVRADLEKFPGYGVNIIQIELGPNSVFPNDEKPSDAAIRDLLRVFDRAAGAGVSVCLLISPHYMPQWAYDRYPDLRVPREGFLRYCLHAPEGRALLKRFIDYLMPRIKDHPALHSICLSNEPINVEAPSCPFAQAAWREWLKKRYGDVATLNGRWASRYGSFDDIPLPEAKVEPTPPAHEFVLFNQEFFAGWHRMLADAIHAIAPKIPVHAKAMTWNFLSDVDQRFGVDAELFAGFSQINGNDSINFYTYGQREWVQDWQRNNMGHDLQRSVGDMPVFNSENHIITDRDTRPVPPEHVRTALWQAAVHGQSATAIWVWERTYDPRSDVAASIMHRPACAEAVGRTGLDLLRLAPEMRALQKLPPRIALLHSTTALVYDRGDYVNCVKELYTALDFTGLKLGFVTERQLIAGTGPRPPVLLVPSVHHLSDEAVKALAAYPGRVVLVGDGRLLDRDAYDRPRESKPDGERLARSSREGDAKRLWPRLLERLPTWKTTPTVSVSHADGSPVWGVEWLAAEYDGRLIVNLVQHADKPERIVLRRGTAPFQGLDLLTGERIDGELTLEPLMPRLLADTDVKP